MYRDLARIYDVLRDEGQYRAWPGYLMELMAEHGCSRGADVIDAACGTGDMAIELRNAGYKVTGIDISGDMLQIAQEKARQRGVDIRFVCQDMKEISVHKPADALICVNDGVNYILGENELKVFFQNVKRVLKQNGLFLFDISSRHKLEAMAGHVYTYDTDDIAYIWNNAITPDGRSLRMDITFFLRNEYGSFDRFEESHVQGLYDEDFIKDMLLESGFLLEAVYSCFSRKAPEAADERLQFVARAVG